MKIYCLFILGLIACNSPEKKYGLAAWLEHNEDSLCSELSKIVDADTFAYRSTAEFQSNEKIIERIYHTETGKLAELRKLVTNYAPCIDISYKYRAARATPFSLFLTADFDTACARHVDTIFRDVGSLKCFTIERYEPPQAEFSKYILITEENIADTLSPEDLRFDVIDQNGQKDVIFYIRKEVMEDTRRDISRDIFGERILLNEISNLRFIYDPTGTKGEMSYKEARTAFGLK